jgi:hypothetical protein
MNRQFTYKLMPNISNIKPTKYIDTTKIQRNSKNHVFFQLKFVIFQVSETVII